MAFWNAPLDEEKHAEKAVQAALEMRRGLKELNNVLQRERGIEINTGIGVNTGPCIVGNMGSSSRFDYSVIGDAVNLASRLEGQCKEYNTDLIISETTMKQAATNEYDRLGEVTVKGKSEPVSIFTIQKQVLTNIVFSTIILEWLEKEENQLQKGNQLLQIKHCTQE